MNGVIGLKAKLGVNVFKESPEFHIKIISSTQNKNSLKLAMQLCPAGLYYENDEGEVAISPDGCLECGTCLIVCGKETLEWKYPNGGFGVQYRLG